MRRTPKNIWRRFDETWARQRVGPERTVLNDGAGLEIFARGQWRERVARPGQPANVARAFSC